MHTCWHAALEQDAAWCLDQCHVREAVLSAHQYVSTNTPFLSGAKETDFFVDLGNRSSSSSSFDVNGLGVDFLTLLFAVDAEAVLRAVDDCVGVSMSIG